VDDQGQKAEATHPLDRRRPIYFADFASLGRNILPVWLGRHSRSRDDTALRDARVVAVRSTEARSIAVQLRRNLGQSLLGYAVTSAMLLPLRRI
jgi:hypothetical protein